MVQPYTQTTHEVVNWKAKVWNDDDKDYVEDFKGETIRVPAKGYIVMDFLEARAFLGKGTPIKKDGQGRVLNPKMLRTEKIHPDFSEKEKIEAQKIAEFNKDHDEIVTQMKNAGTVGEATPDPTSPMPRRRGRPPKSDR